ncbi:MAG: AraC family transcriptional regulator, partial [Corynebacteriales bacterium]|nr:AraC family transcriptional regulator [Mycobacteriales bacterium]
MRTPVTGKRDGEWPAAPEPLPVPVLDSHTHIDLQEVPVSDALEAAAAVGVTRVVQVGVDVASSQWGERVVADWRSANPGVSPAILATVALHPNEAPMLGAGLAAALAQIEQLASLDTVHGLGETGL